jgi:hypothetical protein
MFIYRYMYIDICIYTVGVALAARVHHPAAHGGGHQRHVGLARIILFVNLDNTRLGNSGQIAIEIHLCLYVCVCERERERERGRMFTRNDTPYRLPSYTRVRTEEQEQAQAQAQEQEQEQEQEGG